MLSMRQKSIFLLLAGWLLAIPLAAADETPSAAALVWDLKVGQILEIHKFGLLQAQYQGQTGFQQFKNRITLKVLSVSGDDYLLEGHFTTYIRPDLQGLKVLDRRRIYTEASSFIRESDFYSKFKMSKQGKMTIDQPFLMPNVRNLPVFLPDGLKKDQKWQSDAQELMMESPEGGVRVQFPVNYQYHGREISNVPKEDGRGRSG